MGIITFLAFSAAGIWSTRAITRLNIRVPRIRVPAASSLNKIANERGHSYVDTFVIELPKRIVHSNLPITVEDFAKSFYNSLVFRSFEKPLLKLVLSNLKEPNVDDVRFHTGDKILLWTVTNRARNEILLEWQSAGFRGCTWFHVTTDRRYLRFGSSIGSMKTRYKTRYPTSLSPLELVTSSIQLLKDNPYEEKLLDRITRSTNNIGKAGVLCIHHFYSRILLDSALKTLVLEKYDEKQ